MNKAYQNTHQLVSAAVRAMLAVGMTEREIIAELPRLSTAAVEFLRDKAAA